ncbi:cytochrome P460 family protein [Novipirellula sp. SH528]|uniref:cytochrome P460 family protein n=1 Tax=Novipirellula sp. SH528 TaxID=3454466 RepID=UPI003F9F77B2
MPRKTVVTFAFASLAVTIALATEPSDSELVRDATDLKNLIRITDEPHEMDDSINQACRPLGFNPTLIHDGYGESAFCNVYVNKTGKRALIDGLDRYPQGSMIVKSKLRSKGDKEPELYTVMQKMGTTFDAKNGNWEYSVIDGHTRRILACGRIDSCISCHARYVKTDYITRAYVKQDSGEP